MRLQAGASSDKGKLRPLNEDAYACDSRRGFFVVCDGMGGHAAGEVASQLAVQTIVRQLAAAGSAVGESAAAAKGFLLRTRRLQSALEISNRSVYHSSQENPQQAGMGAAVVSVWIGDNIASVAHVGDSRAYLWHNQHFEQLTRDHSLVEEQVRAGLVGRAESLQSDTQNVLLRALGHAPEVEIELAEVPLLAGDYLLLCTDGLTRMVPDSMLAEAIASLREPKAICDHLVTLANRNGGVDNITVVVVKVCSDSLWKRCWRLAGR
ncbi:MAG: Stp1/IreP family PP2C-type Ser/Thr phosphatase [Terriglobia bacterium]